MSGDATEPAAPRVAVLRGGRPSDEEVAAIVVALTPAAPPAEISPEADSQATPAWRRAAILESVGGAPLSSAADVHAAGRP